MSQQLINRSPDLTQLVNAGYAIRIVDGHLVVDEIPYLDKNLNIRRGSFACPLDATEDGTVPPAYHVMSFAGDQPFDRHGRPIQALGSTSPCAPKVGNLELKLGFSNKLRERSGRRDYRDFFEKVQTYADIIVGEVQAVDSSITPKVGAQENFNECEGPFCFPDSSTARAGISELTFPFRQEVVAIIGLGGTGSYILDHVSKVPVMEIRLIDGDKFFPHNAFRSPGAPRQKDLRPPPYKVDFHRDRYSSMKNGIVAHPEFVDEKNLARLDGVTFAFVAIDPGPAKASIIAKLEAQGIPFVEVGMGLHKSRQGIGGQLRAVLSSPKNRDRARTHIPQDNPSQDQLYTANIQVSELNSLNADIAVQMWKAYRGFYADLGEDVWVYQVETRTLIKKAA